MNFIKLMSVEGVRINLNMDNVWVFMKVEGTTFTTMCLGPDTFQKVLETPEEIEDLIIAKKKHNSLIEFEASLQ